MLENFCNVSGKLIELEETFELDGRVLDRIDDFSNELFNIRGGLSHVLPRHFDRHQKEIMRKVIELRMLKS